MPLKWSLTNKSFCSCFCNSTPPNIWLYDLTLLSPNKFSCLPFQKKNCVHLPLQKKTAQSAKHVTLSIRSCLRNMHILQNKTWMLYKKWSAEKSLRATVICMPASYMVLHNSLSLGQKKAMMHDKTTVVTLGNTHSLVLPLVIVLEYFSRGFLVKGKYMG